jgi:hypothetical protein
MSGEALAVATTPPLDRSGRRRKATYADDLAGALSSRRDPSRPRRSPVDLGDDVLDLDGIDVEAGDDDQLLWAVDQEQVAVVENPRRRSPPPLRVRGTSPSGGGEEVGAPDPISPGSSPSGGRPSRRPAGSDPRAGVAIEPASCALHSVEVTTDASVELAVDGRARRSRRKARSLLWQGGRADSTIRTGPSARRSSSAPKAKTGGATGTPRPPRPRSSREWRRSTFASTSCFMPPGGAEDRVEAVDVEERERRARRRRGDHRRPTARPRFVFAAPWMSIAPRRHPRCRCIRRPASPVWAAARDADPLCAAASQAARLGGGPPRRAARLVARPPAGVSSPVVARNGSIASRTTTVSGPTTGGSRVPSSAGSPDVARVSQCGDGRARARARRPNSIRLPIAIITRCPAPAGSPNRPPPGGLLVERARETRVPEPRRQPALRSSCSGRPTEAGRVGPRGRSRSVASRTDSWRRDPGRRAPGRPARST